MSTLADIEDVLGLRLRKSGLHVVIDIDLAWSPYIPDGRYVLKGRSALVGEDAVDRLAVLLQQAYQTWLQTITNEATCMYCDAPSDRMYGAVIPGGDPGGPRTLSICGVCNKVQPFD